MTEQTEREGLRIRALEALAALALALVWALVVRPGPLSLPYFWDEADVYAPGARWLADHDMSPTPGHFPDVWSRGHPPLLYLLGAIVFRLFGPGPLVGHAITIPFTALALAGTYVLGAELAGSMRGARWVGLGAAMLLATSPLFMSMGAFFLPEMPLTALTVIALVLATRGHVGRAAVVGVLLVWIKETGVGPPIAIAGGLFVEAWTKPGVRRENLRDAARAIGISLVPVLALAVFFVWQRLNAGYFVFPHHQALFADRPMALWNTVTVGPSIFLWHGRWIVTVSALLMFVGAARWRQGRSAHHAGPGRERASPANGRGRRGEPMKMPRDRTSAAIVLLLLGNAVFFAKMFWLERYALPVHPGVCVLLVMTIVACAPRAAVWTGALPITAACVVGLASLHHTSGAPEHTFAFADVVASHQEAFAWIAEHRSEARVLTTWPLTTELREPWLGFVDAPLHAIGTDALDDAPESEVDLVLADTSSSRLERLRSLARARGMHLLTTVTHETAPPLEIWGP